VGVLKGERAMRILRGVVCKRVCLRVCMYVYIYVCVCARGCLHRHLVKILMTTLLLSFGCRAMPAMLVMALSL
jgi:hypothetical protein